MSAEGTGAIAFVEVVWALFGGEGEAFDCALKWEGGLHDGG